MTTTAEKVNNVADYYTSLLIMQYVSKSKASANVMELVKIMMGDGISFDMERAFDIDTAVGPALTIIGKYAGVDRTLYGARIDRTFFELATYSVPTPSTAIGMRTYLTSPYPSSYFNSYTINDNNAYTLTDDELRLLIQIKITTNNIPSSYFEIINVLVTYFPGQFQLFDGTDMTMTLFASTSVSQVARLAIIEKIIPFPSCVLILFFTVEYPTELLTLTSYSSIASVGAGLSTYTSPVTGSFLSYESSETL